MSKVADIILSSHCYYSKVVLYYIGTGGALKKKVEVSSPLQVIEFHGGGGRNYIEGFIA